MGLQEAKRGRIRARKERSEPGWTNRLITQPIRRDPFLLPTVDGNRCAEAMVLYVAVTTVVSTERSQTSENSTIMEPRIVAIFAETSSAWALGSFCSR